MFIFQSNPTNSNTEIFDVNGTLDAFWASKFLNKKRRANHAFYSIPCMTAETEHY